MKLLSRLAVCLASTLAMIGCNPGQLSATPTSPEITSRPTLIANDAIITYTSAPSATYMPSETPTAVPTIAPTSTPTSTPVPTITATKTPTATPDRVIPGYYDKGSCRKYRIGYYLEVDFCIDQVDVLYDYSMNYSISWTFHLTYTPEPYSEPLIYYPVTEHYYLIDNLGKKYNPTHTQYHGSFIELEEGKVITAVVSFSPAPTGARTFTLYDDREGIAITVLLDNPVQVYGDLELGHSPFVLRYQLKKWQAATNEDGNGFLAHLKIVNCTITELPDSTPQGTLINQLKIGMVTYDLYRYYEQEWSVREYKAISGVEGITPEMNPFFRVMIPYNESQDCILDVSEVLAHLQPVTPTSP